MRLSLHKSNNNASLPSSKKGIITLIHIDEIIAMPKTDYQGIRCLNEIQLKENPQLQYLYLTPFTQKEEITPSGDIESTLFSTKISGTFPGNKIEAAEFLKQNINEPFVIIHEDFTENTKFIYGSKYHPLFIKSEYKSDSTGKLWNFTLEQSHASDIPYLYYEGPQLGGRNYLLNTDFKENINYWLPSGNGEVISWYNFDGIKALFLDSVNSTSGAVVYTNGIDNLEKNIDYTLSFDIRPGFQSGSTMLRVGMNEAHEEINIHSTAEFKRYSITIKPKDQSFYLFFQTVVGSQSYLIKNIKLEKGNKATLWTPAPEDIII